MQKTGRNQRTIIALDRFGQQQRDLGEVVGIRLARRSLAALVAVPPGGKIGGPRDEKDVGVHRIGLFLMNISPGIMRFSLSPAPHAA
jgi:hypothetical protein